MDHGNGRSRLRILHVILRLQETNGQYNEHCLPMIGVRDIAIATYFTPQLTPPPEIRLFPGDGTFRGFSRALRRAVDGDYDAIHAHAPQTGALAVVALLAAFRFRRLRSSMVYTVQDSFYDYKPRNKAMMVIALAAFGHVIFCSEAAYDSLPGIWKRLVRGRWTVVQNGADIDRIDRAIAEASPVRDDTTFNVVAIGRLEPVKDFGTLLRAFARISAHEAKLTIIGAGSRESEVRRHIEELGLTDRVTLTGLIPRDEVFVRCANSDVLVSTSLGEGLPVAVIEAMASRCPVVLSDIPPHRELADGEGFIPIIATGDVDGFAREIDRFAALSTAQLNELRERSRDHVVARYSLPIMHAGTEAVYRSLPTVVGRSGRDG